MGVRGVDFVRERGARFFYLEGCVGLGLGAVSMGGVSLEGFGGLGGEWGSECWVRVSGVSGGE